VVETDQETAAITVLRYCVRHDCGTIINPMIVEGQVHGGLVQGIGQALLENCVYDRETGQLVTGSFMDYAMPRADDVPDFRLGTVCTPCTTNPLGTKGCGEAGAIGSPPAVINAVLDALSPLGVKDLDMPASPSRVWEAIRAAKK
jgi:carbon-monoxide dehydrogenase large subunit